MNENTKTLIFVGVAAVASLAGYAASTATRPRPQGVLADTERALFPDFKDPLSAVRMKIASVDETTGTPHSFEVAESKGVWSIPSHEDYPADAAKQLEEAAASLIDLEAQSIVTDKRSEHEVYGVLAPDAKLESGATGIGKQVTIQDATGQTLCDLIIGKPMPDQPNMRYVRLPSQDRVYAVKINVGKLSTSFEDWIEKDLLKIDTFDMREIVMDHSTAKVVDFNVAVEPGAVEKLTYNDKDSKWSLADLAEGEELDTDKVNDLKNSLDQLKIVDVHRKPSGLSRNLKTNAGLTREEHEQALGSLVNRGFLPYEGVLMGLAGETRVSNANGAQYILRFGRIDAGSQAAGEEPKTGENAEGEEAEPKPGENPNRYLMVMAEFDPSFIPKPELKVKEWPPMEELLNEKPVELEVEGEGPKDEEAAAPKDGAAESEEGAAKDADSAEPAEPESKEPAPPKNEDPKSALPNGSGPDGEAKETEAKGAEPETAAKEEKKDEGVKGEEKSEPSAEDEAKRAEDEANKKAAAAKLRDEQDDDRKIDEYKQKLKKGREKVDELNNRFADWYYVISDSMYRKIQLNHADLVKSKEPEKKPADVEGEEGAAIPGELEKAIPQAGKAPPAAAPAKPATPPATTAKPAAPAASAAKPATPAAPAAKPAAPAAPAAKPAAPAAKPAATPAKP